MAKSDKLREILLEIAEFKKAHFDIFKEVQYLTEDELLKQLRDALEVNKGYYKNKKGEYVYVKGIEVTNDLSDLCRMGYNGEDRGVWVHFSELNDRKVGYYDVPVYTFSNRTNPRITDPDNLLVPITKEEFEEQVSKTIQNIIADYPQKRDVREYVDYMERYNELCTKLFDEVRNIQKMLH